MCGTVTCANAASPDEPVVTGIMVITSAQVTAPLPAEHAVALGLDPAVSYIGPRGNAGTPGHAKRLS